MQWGTRGYLSAGAFILVITAMLEAVGAVLLLLFGRLHTHRQTTRVFFFRSLSLEFCNIPTPKSVYIIIRSYMCSSRRLFLNSA